MREKVEEAIAALNSLSSDLGELEKTNEVLKDTKAQMTTDTKALAEIKSNLEKGKSLLTAAQEEAVKNYDRDIFEKGKALTSLNESVEKVVAELNELNVKVKNARDEHNQVIASMESLRKRLTF